MILTDTVSIHTNGFCDIVNITPQIISIINESPISNGIISVFCPGSTGSITTIEYEPGALRDLQKALERIAPSNIPYDHDEQWGDGNGFSHVRAALMKPSLCVPLIGRKPD